MMKPLFVLPVIALAACTPDEPAHKQLSYFKDAGPNRVFVLSMTEPAEAQDVEAIASRLMHTSGQLTIGFIYDVDTAPDGDPVTRAPQYITAMDRMFTPPWDEWRYYFNRRADGTAIFVDCMGPDPDEAICDR